MTKQQKTFIRMVWDYYKREGRHTLPWRGTRNPYRILVSEIMLQQTQVDRVIPKYRAFLKQFPSLKHLARASLKDVLIAWQGLGYNRRAKMLHTCAKVIVAEHRGIFPCTYNELVELPGVGPYTAGAIMAFAFNEGIPIIETNIRTVFLHYFFNDVTQVADKELLPLITATLDRDRVRAWYYAVMDYGAYIKKTYGNPNNRSTQYMQQSMFKGSDREIRGAIIRLLTGKPETRNQLFKILPFEDIRIDAQLVKLMQEGMVTGTRGRYSLPA